MKEHDLYDALGQVGGDLIEKSAPDDMPGKKKPAKILRFRPALIAAVAVLLVAAAVIIPLSVMMNKTTDEIPVTEVPPESHSQSQLGGESNFNINVHDGNVLRIKVLYDAYGCSIVAYPNTTVDGSFGLSRHPIAIEEQRKEFLDLLSTLDGKIILSDNYAVTQDNAARMYNLYSDFYDYQLYLSLTENGERLLQIHARGEGILCTVSLT